MSEMLVDLATEDPVQAFCQRVFSKHREHWPITEKLLAEEFLGFSGLSLVANLDEVSQVCQNRLGIVVSRTPMPDGMRGHNCSFAGKREIVIATNQDYHAAALHTLLHELREILETEFCSLGHPMVTPENPDLERHAEDFAGIVQITAAYNLVPVLFGKAPDIERKWARFSVYVLIVLGTLAYFLSCVSTPQIEANLAASQLPGQ